jgi:H/ACA ribonucleoprotein complex subunit 4
MQELRRTRAGPFVEAESVTLHDLAYSFVEWQEKKDDGNLRRLIEPMENALGLLPKIYVRDSAVDAVCHGADLTAPGVLSLDSNIKAGSMVAVLTLKNEGVALCKALAGAQQMLDAEHGIVSKTVRVIMPRGTYPKLWKGASRQDEQKS